MAFYISDETADTLTLTPVVVDPESFRLLRWVLGGMGGLFFVIAIGLAVGNSEDGADILNLIAGSMVFVSLLVVLVAVFMKSDEGRGVSAFVFDRRLGAVRVSNPQGQPAEAYFAYADIVDVSVQVMSRDGTTTGSSVISSNDSSGGDPSVYHAVVHLRDGGSWYLTDELTRAKAEEQVGRLVAAVRAAGPAVQAVPPPELPPQLTHSTQGRETTLRWRNPLTPRKMFWRLGWPAGMSWMLALVSYMFLILFSAPHDPAPEVTHAVWGCFALALVFFAGRAIWRIRQEANSTYALVFSPESVSYLEESLTTGQVTHRESSPLPEWYGLSYSFDKQNGADEALLMLTRSAHAYYLKDQQENLSFRDRLNLLQEKDQPRPLSLMHLSPVQRLAVVNWVQAQVRKMRG